MAPWIQNLATLGVAIGFKVLGAIAVWIIGSWIIRFTVNMVERALRTKEVDTTLVKYIGSALNILLKVVLIVGIFGYFGVQTTTIAGFAGWRGPGHRRHVGRHAV